MKRRIAVGIAILVVAVLVVAAVAPYFVGRAAESNFKARVAFLNAQHAGYLVHIDSYRRGFYSSEARLSIVPQTEINPQAMRLWAIFLGTSGVPQFDLRINHGPIAFAAFGGGHVSFWPVLYTAEFQGSRLPPMSIVGIFKPEVYIRQYFDGSTESTFSVPPGRYSLGVFGATWQGARMTAWLNGAQDKVRYRGRILPIHYQAQNPETRENYSGSLRGFTFFGAKRKTRYDFWTGTSRMTFEGAGFDVDGKQVVKLAAGRNHSTVHAGEDGKWLGGDDHWTQGGGIIKGWPFSRFILKERVSRVDAPALRGFLDRLHTTAGNADSVSGKRALQDALPLLVRALAPATVTVQVALVAPDGRLDIDAHAAFDANPPAAATATTAADLLDRLDARVTLGFDRKLVDGFSTRVLGGSAAQRHVDQMLDAWHSQGFLKTGSDGREHSVLIWRAGIFSVNGQPVYGENGDKKPTPQD